MHDQTTDVPYGYCHCGCGQRTTIAQVSDRSKGWTRGEPKQYVRYHYSPPAKGVDDDLRAMYTVDADTGCWIWTRALLRGYGQVRREGRSWLAHRYIYERTVGPIGDGLELDHLCRTPRCVNPEHMEPVTGAVNVRRSSVPKLTVEQVRQIRSRLGGESQNELAVAFGVSKSCIAGIARWRTWKDVDGGV